MFALSLALNFLAAAFFIKPKPPVSPPKPLPPLYTVTKVDDGDSIAATRGGDSLVTYFRLMNVDAPDLGQCGYAESKKTLTDLIEGKQVNLDIFENDKYNRPLIIVRLGDIIANEYIVSSGWARYKSGLSSISTTLQKISAQNKIKQIGVFNPNCLQPVNPANSECVIKGNVNNSHKIYFLPGCGTYSTVDLALDQGDQWFCTEEEAQAAGFVKSQNCH